MEHIAAQVRTVNYGFTVFLLRIYPVIEPTSPPVIWAICDTLSLTVIPSYICWPIYMVATRINVRGISPSLNPVNEARIMKAKTIPLAPHSAILGKRYS